MTPPRVAVGPFPSEFATDAVPRRRGRGRATSPTGPTAWCGSTRATSTAWPHGWPRCPTARWVQLPFAGVERVAAAGLLDDERIWTCAKGAYAEPVAEHALALALAGLRHLPGPGGGAGRGGCPAGTSLYDQKVTILGLGGIALNVTARAARSVPGRGDGGAAHARCRAGRGTGAAGGPSPRGARSTPSSRCWRPPPPPRRQGIIGARSAGGDAGDGLAGQCGPWAPRGHGRHRSTCSAPARSPGRPSMSRYPEPLPDGHPLWDLENCIVTSHTGYTIDMVILLLAERIRSNVRRLADGDPRGTAGRLRRGRRRRSAGRAVAHRRVAVAVAADGLEHVLVLVLPAELAAQAEHGELHPLRADAERVVPHLLQELLGGERLAGVADERLEELELELGEADHLAVDADLGGRASRPRDCRPGRRGRLLPSWDVAAGLAAAQQGLDARTELLDAERLRQELLGTAGEAPYLLGA